MAVALYTIQEAAERFRVSPRTKQDMVEHDR